ncbi:hypothetical protein Mgra_00009731, partial [Meloidogyne graminicola]
ILLPLENGDSYNCHYGAGAAEEKCKLYCNTDNNILIKRLNNIAKTKQKCINEVCENGMFRKGCGNCHNGTLIINNVKCKCYECEGEFCNFVVGKMSKFNFGVFILFVVAFWLF